MLRKTIIAAACAASLAACTTTGTGGPPPLPADIVALITKVQNGAKVLCMAMPAAQVIADIFYANSPGLQTANAIITAFCNAIPPQNSALARGLFARPTTAPTLAGVRLEWTYVTVVK